MTSKRASVLIAILMILMAAGLLVSAVFYIRDKARQLETRDKLKQIALAMHACSDVHKMLPPAFDVFADCKYPASVHAHLLPFIGKNPVYPSYLKDGITSAVVPEYYAPPITRWRSSTAFRTSPRTCASFPIRELTRNIQRTCRP